MPIARITKQGLSAIALSVILLWGCIIGEWVVRQRAITDQARTIHEMQILRNHFRQMPVSTPRPVPSRPARPVAA